MILEEDAEVLAWSAAQRGVQIVRDLRPSAEQRPHLQRRLEEPSGEVPHQGDARGPLWRHAAGQGRDVGREGFGQGSEFRDNRRDIQVAQVGGELKPQDHRARSDHPR